MNITFTFTFKLSYTYEDEQQPQRKELLALKSGSARESSALHLHSPDLRLKGNQALGPPQLMQVLQEVAKKRAINVSFSSQRAISAIF